MSVSSASLFGANHASRPRTAPQALPSLTGLRGLLAFWVVSFHMMPNGLGPFRVTSYGYLAVDLFFIMSGFILMHVHHSDFVTGSWDRIQTFLLLRWWRTYPVHIATFLLALFITAIISWKDIPSIVKAIESLALFDSWMVQSGNMNTPLNINTPLWSLQVEWIGYLLFPLLAMSINRMSPKTALASILMVFCLGMGVLVANHNLELDAFMLPLSLVRMAMGFISGCLLWRINLEFRPPTAFSDLLMSVTVLSIVAILLFAVPLLVFPFMVVVISLAAQPGHLSSALFNSRLAAFLGRISFSAYLCHLPILRFTLAFQPLHASASLRLLYDAGALAGVISLATVLCIFIEEPARRYGRRFAQKMTVPSVSLVR